ncbi:MAG: glycosyltransferase family 1 protein [Patescibacteria group bacterium]
MRILVDIRLLSKGGQSGIEEYTVQLLNNLFQSNSTHQWQLFYQGWRKAPLPNNWSSDNTIKIIDWQYPNKLFDIWRPKIDNHVATDLVYSPHLNIIRANHAPRILTIHDLSFIHHPYFFSLKHRLWHKIQSYKNQIKTASVIVTNSVYTKNDLINTLSVQPEKIHAIYPGTNPKLKKMDFTRPEKLKFPYILYLGTIEPRKNIPLIIKAFNIVKQKNNFRDLKLILAGKAGWLYEKIFQEAEKSRHKSDIIFWGLVHSEEKNMLYNLAEAFVYPSFLEGFGFPPLEAQACGCPVIASNRASLPEVLGQSALMVNPWKEKDLVDKLEAVLTDANLKNKLIAEGFKNAQRFNWKKTACELLKLFSRFSS